ncbi:hypothetical protein RSAG8_12137, partial [Rhizoctonia solani AG-8 WAC10335]
MRRAGCERLKLKAKDRSFEEYELSPTSPVCLTSHCRLRSSSHPDHPDSPSRPYRCAGIGPCASLLCSGAEERRVLGSSFAHSGVQVWIRRVHPPCLCVDAPEACAVGGYTLWIQFILKMCRT